jgi:hypothetical protein
MASNQAPRNQFPPNSTPHPPKKSKYATHRESCRRVGTEQDQAASAAATPPPFARRRTRQQSGSSEIPPCRRGAVAVVLLRPASPRRQNRGLRRPHRRHRSMRRPAFPRCCVCASSKKGTAPQSKGRINRRRESPSRQGRQGNAPATHAAGTEGTQRRTPPTAHAVRAGFCLVCPPAIQGTRRGERKAPLGTGKFPSFWNEKKEREGARGRKGEARRGQWNGVGDRACSTTPMEEGRDVCDRFGRWWRRRRLPSPPVLFSALIPYYNGGDDDCGTAALPPPLDIFFCLSLLVPILPYITDKTNSNNASQNEEAC